MLKAPDHQVAGHEAGLGKLGPLIDDSGRFYKPLQGDNRGSEEVAFYESFSSNTHIPEHIRKFFPMYYGTKIMKASTGVDHPHMVLQDLTSARVNPSVMDIKIGSRTWAPDASEAYIAKCLKKDRESTSIPLGFRLSGLQVYIDDESRFYKPDRNYIRKTGPDDVRLLLRKFVSSNPSADMEMGTGSGPGPDCSLASSVYDGPNGILAQLLELKAWFEDQTFYHFYACSFLFVYEKRLGRNHHFHQTKPPKSIVSLTCKLHLPFSSSFSSSFSQLLCSTHVVSSDIITVNLNTCSSFCIANSYLNFNFCI
ncbi:putative inositol-polyphosphate multikinase [Helianthus annuus]|nr:putative inositol-polyphosphate multikinase [Helianthus annuus]